MCIVTDHAQVGFKAAGGVNTAEQALAYVDLVRTVLGDEWLHPSLFRIGASGLLDKINTSLSQHH